MFSQRYSHFLGYVIMALSPWVAWGEAGGSVSQPPFFAFDNGVGRDLQWSIDQQAQTLKALGYKGIGYSGIKDLDQRMAAFKALDLTIFSLYVPCFPGHTDPPFDPQFAEVFKTLEGTSTMLLLTVQGSTTDEQAVRVIRDIADLAAVHQVKIALYPHYGFFVATVRDALRLIHKADRPNLGVSMNLCHELRSGHGPALDQIITEAGSRLFMVSINGAERDGRDWDTLILPLGQGDFDMPHFLTQLKTAGFAGPIGLQCYNVKGDQRENLAHAISVWKTYQLLQGVHQGPKS